MLTDQVIYKFKQSIKCSPVIKKGNYNYFVHPLTDGSLPIYPNELTKIATSMIFRLAIDVIEGIDMVLLPEAMGIPIGQEICRQLNLPYIVVRKRSYGLDGEIKINQQTGYSKSEMFINSVKSNSNIIIIDDVVSTGGTLKAIISSLRSNNINVIAAFTLIEKNNAAKALRDSGYNVWSIANVLTDDSGIIDVI